MNKLDNLKKFAQGGSVKKLEGGGQFVASDENGIQWQAADGTISNITDFNNLTEEQQKAYAAQGNTFVGTKGVDSGLNRTQAALANSLGINAQNNQRLGADGEMHGLSQAGEVGLGVAANAATQIFNGIDKAAMGDKNFGAQSAAIDSAVHGVSGALMKSGNPYAMAAGAALEGANFLTKAGGQTVQGFDVDINNGGYGNLGHMDSSSSRDFGAMIGLGGLNQKSMQRKLAQRNQQAMMALEAASISADTSQEQEARSNSKDNILRQNQIALAGGIDTSLLAN